MTKRTDVDLRHGEAQTAVAALKELTVEPICVRVATAVKLTGIPRSTLYELISAGEIGTVKIGRSTFVRYASLKRLFEKH